MNLNLLKRIAAFIEAKQKMVQLNRSLIDTKTEKCVFQGRIVC
jgi:hypothetical protein